MNIFHHSAKFLAKHKYHHHLIIGLIVVAVAGTGGVVLYKKFASAATFAFTQSSTTGGWATLDANATAAHPGNQTNWSKYSASTGVSASASRVFSTSARS